MENCLVTKLKNSVNNESLQYFSYIRVKIYKSDLVNAFNMSCESNGASLNPITKVVSGDVKLVRNGVEYSEMPLYTTTDAYGHALGTINVSNAEGVIIVDKYTLSRMQCDGRKVNPYFVMAEDLVNSNVVKLQGFSIEGTVEDLSKCKTLSIIDNTASKNSLENRLTGSINAFHGHPALTSINFMLSGSNITGNIEGLGLCPNITNIVLNYTNVNGSIEGFVENQKKIGRKNATIAIIGGGNSVTYNGIITSNNITVVFDENGDATVNVIPFNEA